MYIQSDLSGATNLAVVAILFLALYFLVMLRRNVM
ncbi:hypothetical protein LMG23994_05229 [Cupriavidus pinatubonensis]|uniref:Uncharacterized protein n=1 Tax=Cupriavidus pinatubonensis TaxID=248026 RepID=A0ABM8XTN9_9BURK|nr:hypothetical protein LMG23994_05229 [Cupriavidus pinatubonensis]